MQKERRLIHQGGVPIGYFEGRGAVLDADFFGCATGRELTRQKVPISWLPGIANRLKQEAEGERKDGRRVRVYQLNSGAEPEKKFVTYERLCELYGGACRTHYHLVFDGSVHFDSLNELYELFNAGTLPKGYIGRGLSISDVVELCHEGPLYYVDAEEYVSIQWKEN